MLFGVIADAMLQALASIMLRLESLPTNDGALAWFTLTKRLSWALADLAVPAGLLVSLLRYRLYDAETAISRSVAYGALTVALVGVFAGSQKVVEMVGEATLGGQLGAVASALAAAVAAAAIAPLHGLVTRWAERRFQGVLVHLRHGLPLLVGDLRETASPAVLADAMLARVEGGVRAVHGAVIAADRVIAVRDIPIETADAWWISWTGQLDPVASLGVDRADPLFPLQVALRADGLGLVGWLLLGPRPDGSLYGKDERDTLRAIADPVARALFIAIQRERHDIARRQREDSLGHVVKALCRVVQERLGVDVHAMMPLASAADAGSSGSPQSSR